MVNPVQIYNGSQVNFRGSEELFNSPGKFSTPLNEQPNDVVEINKSDIDAPKKKHSIGKTIAKLAGGILVLGGAAWGIYYSKGAKWINKNAVSTTEKIKNACAKPGEWIDENIVKKLFSRSKQNIKEAANEEIDMEDIINSAEELTK